MHPAARVLHEQVARERTPGLSYLHFSADSILFRYRDGTASVVRAAPVERSTTFDGLSVTKTVTAVAVLQLVDIGAVALESPAAAYRPGFPYAGDLTVRRLLARSQLSDRLLREIIASVTGMSYERYVGEEVLARIGVDPEAMGFTIDPSRHACGHHRRRRVTYPPPELLRDRSRGFAAREGAWERCRPYRVNGPAHPGLVGTADGFARYLQALLDDAGTLLTPASQALLLAEPFLNGGAPAATGCSWFRGTLGAHRYVDHGGGGDGYYAEVRIYPALRRGSVLLCNRTGLRNDRLLDRADRCLIDPTPTVVGAGSSPVTK